MTTAPHDLHAEQAALGGMLLSSAAIDTVVEAVASSADFYRPAHAMAFETICDLYGQGLPADAVSVAAELDRRGQLGKAGGPAYLHTLIEVTPSAANAGHYARIVAEKAVLRRLAEAGLRTAQLASGPVQDVAALVAASQDAVGAVDRRTDQAAVKPLVDMLGPVLDSLEAGDDGPAGLLTGFADLDELTDGMRPGELWVIAARPGVGKSTLGMDLCRASAIRYGHPTAFFSLEMTSEEIVTRLLAAEARVPHHDLRKRKIDADGWARIGRKLEAISSAPLFVDDTPGQTIGQIRAKSRRLVEREQVRLIVVDYLQIVKSGRSLDNRTVEVAEIAEGLKALGKELGVVVVALAQLNRGVESRAEKRPLPSDLRESGAIEQAADVIILLHREDVTSAESARAGEADFIVGKDRHGPTGTITVAFQGHYSRFVDMAN